MIWIYNTIFKGLLYRYLTDKNKNDLYLEKINDNYNLTLDKIETFMELYE